MSEATYHLLTKHEVLAMARVSNATLYRLCAAGRFPKPLKVGPQVSRWRSDEIAAHLERLSAAREAA